MSVPAVQLLGCLGPGTGVSWVSLGCLEPGIGMHISPGRVPARAAHVCCWLSPPACLGESVSRGPLGESCPGLMKCVSPRPEAVHVMSRTSSSHLGSLRGHSCQSWLRALLPGVAMRPPPLALRWSPLGAFFLELALQVPHQGPQGCPVPGSLELMCGAAQCSPFSPCHSH